MPYRAVFLLTLLLIPVTARSLTFTVSSSADSGPNTLRQAILDANANPGADNIVFTTPTVVTTSDLPDIVDVVLIDGTVGAGRVDISGSYFMAALRFGTGTSGSTLTRVSMRGYKDPLVISGGMTVTDSSFEYITSVVGYGNTIGGGNTFGELGVSGGDNIIEQNTISHVRVFLGPHNHVGTIGKGNTIGPGAPTTLPHLEAVSVWAGHTFIEGNEIVGPHESGIQLVGNVEDNGATITGNTIHGQTAGILVWSLGVPGTYHGANIFGNSIYDVDVPIDLMDLDGWPYTGSSPNDPAPDADNGGNHLQNYPVVTSAVAAPAGLTVDGVLTSAPLTTYRIEIFGNPSTAPEARASVGTFSMTTDAFGNAPFTQLLPNPSGPNNVAITATATSLTTNETSEVNTPVIIDLSGELSFDPVSFVVSEADGSVTLTVVRNGGSANTVTIDFTTADGTAIAPGDYATTSGTLTFDPGVTSQTITVPVVFDGGAEPDDAFTVTLSNPTNGATVGASTASVTIAGVTPIPTASTWGLIALALGLIAVAVLRV